MVVFSSPSPRAPINIDSLGGPRDLDLDGVRNYNCPLPATLLNESSTEGVEERKGQLFIYKHDLVLLAGPPTPPFSSFKIRGVWGRSSIWWGREECFGTGNYRFSRVCNVSTHFTTGEEGELFWDQTRSAGHYRRAGGKRLLAMARV